MHRKKQTTARSSDKNPSQGRSKTSGMPPFKKRKLNTVPDDIHLTYAALDIVPEQTTAPSPSPPRTSKQKASKKAGKKPAKDLESSATDKAKEKAKRKKKAQRSRKRAHAQDSSEDLSSDKSDSEASGSESKVDTDSNSDAPPSSDEEPVKKTRKRKPVDKNNLDLSKLSNHTPISSELLKRTKKKVAANILIGHAFPSLQDSTATGAVAWKDTRRTHRDLARSGK